MKRELHTDAQIQGFDAYILGIKQHENPYDEDTEPMESYEWNFGWCLGYHEAAGFVKESM